MVNIFKSLIGLVASKAGLAVVSALGFSGGLIIIVLFVIIFVVVGAVAGIESNNTVSAGSGMYSCSPTGELNVSLWNEMFEDESSSGALYGHGDTIIDLSEQNGIDPVLVAAIIMHETGFGTSDAAVLKNNPGGIMDPALNWSTTKTFSSMEEGLTYTVENLQRRMNEGYVTVEELGSIYAPIGAANDPTGLNENWLPRVNEISADLGGLTMNCEVIDVEMIGDTVWPVPFTKHITSHFQKNRLNPVTNKISDHNGIDIASNGVNGTPAVSFMDGTVTFAGSMSGYGNVVFVVHENGMETRYAHLQSTSASVNDVVQAGQQVGLIGSSGNSTGPHLHFEILINDNAVDPFPYLQPFLNE